MNPERAIAYRKQVSALIEAVIGDEISARTAINCWPTYCNRDLSVQCAYTMLWYFEADEDRHHQEVFYSDIQLQTLREAFGYLKKGEPLPLALLREYQAATAPPEYSGKRTWQQPLQWLVQQAQMIRAILETNPLLNKKQKKPKGPR